MGLTIIKDGHGNIKQISGGTISIVNGKIFTNGQAVNEINTDEKVINITIEGDVERLEVDYCKTIKVTGNAKRIHTSCGDIEVGGDVSGDVHTNCGSISCGNVDGDCHTNMGSIHHRK